MFRSMAAAVLAVGAAGARAHSSRHANRHAASRRAVSRAREHILPVVSQQVNPRRPRARLDQRGGSARSPDAWEKVVRKLRAHQMPPRGAPARRGDAHGRADRARSGARQPGRRGAQSRPNRHVPPAQPHRIPQRHPRSARARHRRSGAAAERLGELRVRQHHGRQPLADAARELCLRRGKISQLAVGRPSLSPGGSTVRLRPDLTQESHLEGCRSARAAVRGVARVSGQRRLRDHDPARAIATNT